jgi:microcompartment protein CcmL/EutN
MARATPEKPVHDKPVPGSDAAPALAFLELSSIARGLVLTDAAVKTAPVRILFSKPVSSGKHALLLAGDVASVEAALNACIALADGTLLRQVLIPGVHPSLAPFLDSLLDGDADRERPGESVGIVESGTLVGAVLSADRALKAADVRLCRMRLGQGIGGKAYYTLTGSQADVEAACESAQTALRDLESLGRVDVIPRAEAEALEHF